MRWSTWSSGLAGGGGLTNFYADQEDGGSNPGKGNLFGGIVSTHKE